MTRQPYTSSAMVGDCVRTAAALFPTAAILATVPVGMVAATVLGGFAILFAVFGIRTALRHGTQIEATETGLHASGLLQVSISWSELDRIKLSYYCPRRAGH